MLPTAPITKEDAESTLTSIRWLRDGMFVAWAAGAFLGSTVLIYATSVNDDLLFYLGVLLLGGLGGGVGYQYGRVTERHALYAALTRKVRNPD